MCRRLHERCAWCPAADSQQVLPPPENLDKKVAAGRSNDRAPPLETYSYVASIVQDEAAKKKRHEFLRKIGYKL